MKSSCDHSGAGHRASMCQLLACIKGRLCVPGRVLRQPQEAPGDVVVNGDDVEGWGGAEGALHHGFPGVHSRVPWEVLEGVGAVGVAHMPHVGYGLHVLVVVVALLEALGVAGPHARSGPLVVPRGSYLPAQGQASAQLAPASMVRPLCISATLWPRQPGVLLLHCNGHRLRHRHDLVQSVPAGLCPPPVHGKAPKVRVGLQHLRQGPAIRDDQVLISIDKDHPVVVVPVQFQTPAAHRPGSRLTAGQDSLQQACWCHFGVPACFEDRSGQPARRSGLPVIDLKLWVRHPLANEVVILHQLLLHVVRNILDQWLS